MKTSAPVLLLLFAGLAGCVTARPNVGPLTSTELAQTSPNAAPLVEYLAQPGASPAVCDFRSGGARLAGFSLGLEDRFLQGLLQGTVEPSLWQRCAELLLASLPPRGSTRLLSALGPAYRELVSNPALDLDPRLAIRLDVLQQLYVHRKPGLEPDPALAAPLFADLQRALTQKRLGPVAARSIGVSVSFSSFFSRPSDT